MRGNEACLAEFAYKLRLLGRPGTGGRYYEPLRLPYIMSAKSRHFAPPLTRTCLFLADCDVQFSLLTTFQSLGCGEKGGPELPDHSYLPFVDPFSLLRGSHGISFLGELIARSPVSSSVVM